MHVEDISNPDYLTQRDVVMKTLSLLNIKKELLDSVIRVGNKVDKVDRLSTSEPNFYYVSCADGRGLVELMAAVDKVASCFSYSSNLHYFSSFLYFCLSA